MCQSDYMSTPRYGGDNKFIKCYLNWFVEGSTHGFLTNRLFIIDDK